MLNSRVHQYGLDSQCSNSSLPTAVVFPSSTKSLWCFSLDAQNYSMCSSPGALVLLQVTLCFSNWRKALNPADCSCSAHLAVKPLPCMLQGVLGRVGWGDLLPPAKFQPREQRSRLHQVPNQSNPWDCSKWDQTVGAGSQLVQSLGSRHCHLHAHLLGFGII